MESGDRQVTATVPGAPTTGSTYPILLLRWWLVRARLEARLAVKQIRPADSPDDRRLVAFGAAAVFAVFLVFCSAVAGFSASSGVLIVAIGFFAALGGCLALVLGPEDTECLAEQAELAAV